MEKVKSNAENVGKASKTYSFLHQVLVIGVILLISKIIESFIPIPMPASVIGLVLMFIALSTGIIKLGEVEGVGSALTNNIGFLFVPAGVSVINSLGILSKSPILIISLIIISTILLLLCTGFVSQMLVKGLPFAHKSHKHIAKGHNKVAEEHV
ncbi:murein hydrolase transporter LrgA [Staphylococcus condimenti]|uniref:Antiholin-like murein hydrolase modulator LrgA n=2 Tax=Staphylococcus TaxID=1279 RepID=A0A143PCU0_9STAP|nr:MULTISPECIES: antiholin-like murein hydrolase modulator LrgA [Staphylococcus]AMY06335.1 murein hydrolase transporter LrgA [Staphylococcus condimenti]APR60218.1 murein hydrolase transporter LrgA [Staphylococcus condimenti]MDK8644326.1 antiholin-like murein hydrolase modulator LrgA [Staphylococcus condimenti]OFP00179.1 murein hydrolase transporter LrgA [Staphylococcus sp. HMSC065E08]PNZ60489.1 murein hydrolase transporter LrgA [Staphylococcus condimenti]